MNWYYFIKSLFCFIAVFVLYKYDLWWRKNKVENNKEALNDYDKTVRPVRNFGLKIMLFILAILLLVLSFKE